MNHDDIEVNDLLFLETLFIENHPIQDFSVYMKEDVKKLLVDSLFDTLRVFTLRILDRRSPFSPDRNHVHHFLLDLGLSHRMVTFTCITANIIFIATAYFLRNMDVTLLIGILFCMAIVFIVTIYYYSRQKNKAVSRSIISKNEVINSHKRLSLASEPATVEID